MHGFITFITFAILAVVVMASSTLENKVVTGDPTPFQSTSKQLVQQWRNTFGN